MPGCMTHCKESDKEGS